MLLPEEGGNPDKIENEVHPKSFVSNFWGAVHFETALFFIPYFKQGLF